MRVDVARVLPLCVKTGRKYHSAASRKNTVCPANIGLYADNAELRHTEHFDTRSQS